MSDRKVGQDGTNRSSNPNDSTERYYAEMEAARNLAEDAYFIARPNLQRNAIEQMLFRAGFERGFASLWNRALSGDSPSAVETTPVHYDPTGKTREPPHCPSCNCGAENGNGDAC